MGAPSRDAVRRGSYREPTVTGILETTSSDLWGAGVAGERSDLHKVLFVSLGGTLDEWDHPAERGPDAAALFDGTSQQASAVIEWLSGRERARHTPATSRRTP